MEKKIKGRDIIFKKESAGAPKETAQVSRPRPTSKTILKQSPDPSEKTEKTPSLSDQVVSWVASRPLFKANKALMESGMDTGNASRLLNQEKPVIPDKFLPALVEILKQYGFVPQ